MGRHCHRWKRTAALGHRGVLAIGYQTYGFSPLAQYVLPLPVDHFGLASGIKDLAIMQRTHPSGELWRAGLLLRRLRPSAAAGDPPGNIGANRATWALVARKGCGTNSPTTRNSDQSVRRGMSSLRPKHRSAWGTQCGAAHPEGGTGEAAEEHGGSRA